MTKPRLPVLPRDTQDRGDRRPHRRDLTLLDMGWIGTLGSMTAPSAAALRGLVPNLLYEPNLRYRAGRPTDYLDGSDTFLDDIRVFVQRKGSGYGAMWAVCPPPGCAVSPGA